MLKKVRLLTALLLLGHVLAGCEMDDQDRYSAYQKSRFFKNGASARAPEEHTVPQSAGDELVSAETATISAQRLAAGKNKFQIFCAPCHGPLGDGDGKVVQRGFPSPPALRDPVIANQTPQQILETILHGKGNSPAYESKLSPEEAWEVAVYVHELGRRENSEITRQPEAPVP